MENQNKYFLYSDGNRFPKINRSGYGGYIEAPSGQVVVEYTQEIKEEEHKHNFELWGIITGLEIAQQMGIKDLMCRCDDKTLMIHVNAALKDIKHLENVYGNKRGLIEKVINLAKGIDNISFHYVPRNENKYSDTLSRKYIILLEKNFLADHQKLLDKSTNYFLTGEAPPHSIYYHSDKLTFVPFEHNPFLVSQKRNRKQKIFRKGLTTSFDSFWNLDIIYKIPDKSIFTVPGSKKEIDSIALKKYNDETNTWDYVDGYLVEGTSLKLNVAIDIFNRALDKIKEVDSSVWIYSNIEGLTDVFHQKKPVSKEIFDKFLTCSQKMKEFDKIIYHRIPKEIEHKVKNKLQKKKEMVSAEQTVELMRSALTPSKRNKYFGQLMSIMIKNLELNRKELISSQEKIELKNELSKKYQPDLVRYRMS